jgi:signal transduction histidine kinase
VTPPAGLPASAEVAAAPALAAAVLAAASASQLEATLRQIVDAAARHVDAGYGALGVLTSDARRLDRFVVVGTAGGEPADHLPGGHAIRRLLLSEVAALSLGPPDEELLAAGVEARATYGGDPAAPSVLGVRVRAGDTVFGNLYLAGKRGGGPFTAADVEVAQALAAVAGLAIENAHLAEQSETRRRWGQAATDMATALLSGDDPDDVLRAASARVLALTGADIAGVLAPSLNEEDDTLTIVAAAGPAADDVEGVRVPLAGSYVGNTYESGLPRLIRDISKMPVVGHRAAVVIELTAGFGPAMVVPVGNAPGHGLLVALRASSGDPFGDDDLELLTTFATRASVVLQLARVQERERRLQVQADRDRIARDLHDHVVQRIFAVALSLDRLSRSLQPKHAEAAARLARSVDELDGTMAEIRAAIFELHQEDGPEPSTVRRQLADVVRQVTEGHALRRDVRFRGAVDDLPRELAPDLVAVVRELVTNVVRHAAAGRVTVTVEAGDEVVVGVADDGTGLPPVTARSGLANLADRAERRGGRLMVSAGPSGTEVFWAVPFRRSR